MFLFITTIISFSLSLLTKLLADHFLTDRIPVLGSFFGLQYSLNPGIAFGIRFPPFLQTLLIGAALCLVVLFAIRHRRTVCSSLGFGLIIGGALANIADRFLDGMVTDFIQVGTFPVFNLADSCITVGVGVLLLEMVFVRRRI